MRFERRSEKTLWLAILLHPVAFFCFLFAWQYVGVKMRKWTEPAYTDEWSITLGIVLSGVVTVWSASGYAIGVWACWDRVHLIPARQLAGAGMLVIIIIVAGVFGLSLVGELAPGHVM